MSIGGNRRERVFEDLTGMRFGRLIAVSRAEDHITKNGYKSVMWNCICDCGNKCIVRSKSLKSGDTKSCGCLSKEKTGNMARKHRGFGTRLYTIWISMRQRCNNPKNNAYHNYGGRGITICKEWDDFNSFREWSLSNGYNEKCGERELSLDRIDVNKRYSPDNCRFVSMRDQACNRRDSIILEHNGESHSLSDWARIMGVKYQTLWKRYKRNVDIFQ